MMVKEEPKVLSFQAEAAAKRTVSKKEEVDKAAARAKTQVPDPEECSDDEDVKLPEDPVPSKALLLGDLSAAMLRDKVLAQIEPRILSSANIRAMKAPADKNQAAMLKLVEFVVGHRGTFHLNGKYRCFNYMAMKFKVRAHRSGDRSYSLALPPQWPSDGIHEIDSVTPGEGGDETEVEVSHRFSKDVVTIKGDKVPPFKHPDDLFIDDNRSDVLSALASKCDPSGSKKVYLAGLFKDQQVISVGAEASDDRGGLPGRRPVKREASSPPGPQLASRPRVDVKEEAKTEVKEEEKVDPNAVQEAAGVATAKEENGENQNQVRPEVAPDSLEGASLEAAKVEGAKREKDETAQVPPPPPPASA